MHKHNKQKLGALLISSALLSGFAHAETAKEVVKLQNSDFIVRDSYLYTSQVTALKSPTPIINIPQSLSIINSETIAERGFNSIGDIIDYTPGVNMSQGEGHRDAVVFRGVRSTADFFVDGVRDDVQYYRPLYNVEQVEILRGPNALFFGRGGTGGVLNRVMKKSVIGEDFNAYNLSVDSFGAYEIQADSNVSIDDNVAFRINAHYESLENDRDFYEGDRYGVTPTFTFQLSEDTTLNASYEYLDHERFIDRGVPTSATGRPVETFEDIVFGDPDLNIATLEAHVFRLALQHRFSDTLKGNLTASFGDYEKFYGNFYPTDYDAATDTVELDGYIDTTERQNTVLAGNLVGQLFTGDIEHTWVLGGEYIDTSSDQDRFNPDWSNITDFNSDLTPRRDLQTIRIDDLNTLRNGSVTNINNVVSTNDYTTFLNDDTRADLEVFSVYLQNEIALTKELQIVLGARFDSFEIEVDDVANNAQGSQTDEEFSPRLGIVYKPQENISLYASYSETFLPQSGEQFANLGDAGLDPDQFTNLEAGFKWDFAQGLSLTAAIFEIQQDLVEDNGLGGGRTVEAEISGFETQIQGQLTDSWFISAGYSYLEGETAAGVEPRELPENMFSLWNRYQLTDDLALGLGAIYQDESLINAGGTQVLPDYVRVDAAAYYQVSENLRVQLNIENLFDELYFPNAHATHQASVGAPLHARLSVSGKF